MGAESGRHGIARQAFAPDVPRSSTDERHPETARPRAKRLLDTYRQPALDPAIVESLDDFVAEEMTPEEKSAAVAHLGECRSCVAYDESYRRTIALERSLKADDRQA